MKTITRRAATVVAVGALSLGGLVVAAPVLAGGGPSGPGPAVTAGRGPGYGMGSGHHNGTCMQLTITGARGTLSTAQQATLASMAQEEKLAHDLYAAFAGRYDAVIFDHIAAAETQHLTAVRTLLERYGVTDPTAGQPAGAFGDPTIQATYDRLLAQGNANLSAALGRT